MPTSYDGIPGNVVAPTAVNIASSTNTNPITVTVSGALPADFATGVLVDIQDHQVNTSANGVRVATVTGASTFTIPVAGVGVGGATGTVQPLNMTPAFAIPSDGDADNNASIQPSLAALADRAQFLASRVGVLKIARRTVIAYQNLSNVTWCHWPAGAVTIGTVVQFVSDLVAWGTVFGPGAVATPVSGLAPIFAADGIAPGDLVMVKLQTSIQVPVLHRIALYGAIAAPGVTPAWPGGYAAIIGASAAIDAAGTGNPTSHAVTIEGVMSNSSTIGGIAWMQPVLYPLTNGSPVIQFAGDTLVTFDIWRPTGQPQ
jgi:hypothetical protein